MVKINLLGEGAGRGVDSEATLNGVKYIESQLP